MTQSGAASRVTSRVIWLAILLAALVDGAAHAQPWAGAAGFGIEVNDRGGRPVAGVSVVLAYLGTPGNGPELTTDADGRAAHGGLAEGMWVVSVRHPQFLGYDAELRLDAGRKPFEERAAQVKTSDSTERLKIRFYSVAGSPESPRDEDPPASAEEREEPRAESAPSNEEAQRSEDARRAEEARREQQEAARQAQADQAEAMRRQREAEDAAATAAREQARAAQQEAKRLEREEREEREQREAERAAESAKRRVPEPATPPESEVAPPKPNAPPQGATTAAAPSASAARPASDPPAATPAPAPPRPASSPAPTAPVTTSREAPPATPPIVDRTTAPPLPLRSPLLRTSRDGTCRECRPNEWSVTAAGEPRAAGPPDCPESLRPLVVAMGQLLSAAPAVDFASTHAGALLAPAGVAEGLPDVSDVARDYAAGGCQVLAVKLPRDARFQGFQLEIEGTGGVLPCIPDQDCPGNVGRWATLPVVEDTPSGKVVASAFRHAGGATARPRLTVYFLPPSGWSP